MSKGREFALNSINGFLLLGKEFDEVDGKVENWKFKKVGTTKMGNKKLVVYQLIDHDKLVVSPFYLVFFKGPTKAGKMFYPKGCFKDIYPRNIQFD